MKRTALPLLVLALLFAAGLAIAQTDYSKRNPLVLPQSEVR
jgi:hypothetical protein